MKFLRRCKNKRVIAIVLSFLISLSAVFTSQANTKNNYQDNNNNVRTEVKVSTHKSIGIKTPRKPKQISQIRKYAGTPMVVGATAYAGDKITYIGTVPKWGTIAVDPRIIPHGTKVYIPEFNMIFTAEDTGSAIKGNRIDIFMNSEEECVQWGFKTITIYIITE